MGLHEGVIDIYSADATCALLSYPGAIEETLNYYVVWPYSSFKSASPAQPVTSSTSSYHFVFLQTVFSNFLGGVDTLTSFLWF